MTQAPHFPPRAELNISTATGELLALIDKVDDGDAIAQVLESTILALVDISGQDPNRPAVSRPTKVARRAIERAMAALEEAIETQD